MSWLGKMKLERVLGRITLCSWRAFIVLGMVMGFCCAILDVN